MKQKTLFFFVLFILFSLHSYSQQPKSGTYTYSIAFAEWGGKSMGTTCLVKIIEDSITVIHNGGTLSGKKGDIIAAGKIRFHKKSKRWIIMTTPSDLDADHVGSCADGPVAIDFERKKIWLC